MRILAVCMCIMMAAGLEGVQLQKVEFQPTIEVDISEDEGMTVNATDVRFGVLVHTVIGKMVEMEKQYNAPSISMSTALANRVVSMRIKNEKNRGSILAALEAAGNCTMVASEDGNHATFKEK